MPLPSRLWFGDGQLIVPILADGRVTDTLDVESDSTGAFGGASILDCERLADAMRPL